MNEENSITAYVSDMIDRMEKDFVQNGNASIVVRRLKTSDDVRVNISILLTPTAGNVSAIEAAVGNSDQ